ncbi:MAG: hypothetical protein IJM09_04610, partial [Neisseriaceae bacterium]|nr:hypothetical protein [Neisseriaceae bacterium]
MKRLLYFLLALLPALIAAALLFLGFAKIDTAMSSLLPQNLAENSVFRAVEDAQNRRLNETAIVLVGAENPQQAFENAGQIADLWRQSGLFDQVENTLHINIDDLTAINQQMGVALLPDYQAELLLHNPDEYFQEYAQDLLNPFSGSLISPTKDWLGFSRFLSQKQGVNQLNWSAEYNALYSEYENKTWGWVRAVPNKKAIAHIPQLVQKTQDLFMKCRYIDDLTNHKGITFATGTPIATPYQIPQTTQIRRLLNAKFHFNTIFIAHIDHIYHRSGKVMLLLHGKTLPTAHRLSQRFGVDC